MDKLAEGVGPEGRKLFENFLKQVNKLQEQQNAANRREPGFWSQVQQGYANRICTYLPSSLRIA